MNALQKLRPYLGPKNAFFKKYILLFKTNDTLQEEKLTLQEEAVTH